MNNWTRREFVAAGAAMGLMRVQASTLEPLLSKKIPASGERLFRGVSDKNLPSWAEEFAESWGQFFLKFIISHPAVTCVIPATSKPHHMLDNLGAGNGIMPDAATRARIVDYFKSL